jgi:hypothetical protein
VRAKRAGQWMLQVDWGLACPPFLAAVWVAAEAAVEADVEAVVEAAGETAVGVAVWDVV